MHLPRRFALATAAACALAAALPAAAQDKPVELKFAHWLPANHPLARTGFLPSEVRHFKRPIASLEP